MTSPTIGGQRLITGDHVCAAVQSVLVAGLKPWLATPELRSLSQVKTWLQVPTVEAVQSAATPVGAITSPGWSSPPVQRGRGRWDATWRVTAAIYDRDADYDATQWRTRAWSALMRTVLAQSQSLGGLAQSVTLIDEAYDGEPSIGAARTLGLAMVDIDVVVLDVVPAGAPITTTSPGPVTATSTSTSVAVLPVT